MDYHKNYHRNKVSTIKKEAYQTKIEEGKDDTGSIWKLFEHLDCTEKGSSKVNNFEIKTDNDIISDQSSQSIDNHKVAPVRTAMVYRINHSP